MKKSCSKQKKSMKDEAMKGKKQSRAAQLVAAWWIMPSKKSRKCEQNVAISCLENKVSSSSSKMAVSDQRWWCSRCKYKMNSDLSSVQLRSTSYHVHGTRTLYKIASQVAEYTQGCHSDTVIVYLQLVAKLMKPLKCPLCSDNSLELTTDDGKRQGTAIYSNVPCPACQETLPQGYMSNLKSGENSDMSCQQASCSYKFAVWFQWLQIQQIL